MSTNSRNSDVASELEGHRLRNEKLVERLREAKVALDVAREIDLHFLLPGSSAADSLVGALERLGFNTFKVGEPDSSGVVSVTAKVSLPVETVVQVEFIEPLVRAASLAGGVHDGWGTSID